MNRVALSKRLSIFRMDQCVILQAECVVIGYNRHKARGEEPIAKVGTCVCAGRFFAPSVASNEF